VALQRAAMRFRVMAPIPLHYLEAAPIILRREHPDLTEEPRWCPAGATARPIVTVTRRAEEGEVTLPAGHAVSARAVIAGLLLIPVNTFFLVHATWTVGGFTGSESLFVNTVGLLFLLSLFNRWLRHRGSRRSLGMGEMLTVYLMLGISTGLTSSVWDLGGSLAGTITYPFWFATGENKWREMLWPNLPTWLTVQNRDVLEGFYAGRAEPYAWDVIGAWLTPALWWAAIMGAVMWVCLCLNSIVRRRWADDEKLPFPMTMLPVQLADERIGLLHNRLFWLAVALSVGIGVWNTLTGVAPSLPGIPLGFDYTSFVENRRPWDFIRYRGLEWGPWSLGLCYLMPLDLAFSLFVFDVFWTAEYVLSGYFGWSTSAWSGFPYGEQQTAGGFIAILVAAVWLDRRYLLEVLKRAAGLRPALPDEGQEALSSRGAVLGAAAGVAFLWWVLARGGMQWWAVLSFLSIYFLMCLVISRLRAQLGPPTNQLYGTMPNWVLPTLVGTRTLGPRTLGMLLLLRPYLQEQRNNPCPLQLEGLKMAEGGRMERPRLAMALAVAAPVTLLCYFWANVHLGYHMGLGTAEAEVSQISVARWGALELDEALRYPSDMNRSGTMAIGFGLVFTLLLTYLKLTFQWWPLHPVAYPIAPASTIQSMTPAIFGTWLFKAVLLRYGGLRAHRRALPFFLGLLAGGATVSLLERVLFAALGIRI